MFITNYDFNTKDNTNDREGWRFENTPSKRFTCNIPDIPEAQYNFNNFFIELERRMAENFSCDNGNLTQEMLKGLCIVPSPKKVFINRVPSVGEIPATYLIWVKAKEGTKIAKIETQNTWVCKCQFNKERTYLGLCVIGTGSIKVYLTNGESVYFSKNYIHHSNETVSYDEELKFQRIIPCMIHLI